MSKRTFTIRNLEHITRSIYVSKAWCQQSLRQFSMAQEAEQAAFKSADERFLTALFTAHPNGYPGGYLAERHLSRITNQRAG